MAESEFEIIRRYFTRETPRRDDVLVGVGDDAAVLRVPPDADLVVSMDTLVAGVHFPSETSPAAIGHKALAVNLSDLAAMGAQPAWATLSLTLPAVQPCWLEEFSASFLALASHYGIRLVGGDLCRGPLSVTVQVHGFVPHGKALCRAGAQSGDAIYVTGTPGDAGLALRLLQSGCGFGEECRPLRDRLEFPQPRLEAGEVLRAHASAAIDISDGLLADLGHILSASAAGASVLVDELPRSAAFTACLALHGEIGENAFPDLPLTAGDDYELCFTVAPAHASLLEDQLNALPGGCCRIGTVEPEPGIRCLHRDGTSYQPRSSGYLHFGNGAGDG